MGEEEFKMFKPRMPACCLPGCECVEMNVKQAREKERWKQSKSRKKERERERERESERRASKSRQEMVNESYRDRYTMDGL